MAAVTTKKINGDAAVQLTFPLNFQRAYNAPLSFYPSFLGDNLDIMVGDDFQSEYHETKRLEANQSVMNGLQARQTAERLLLTGPHNYHVPKPVLGQRIYANPTNGAESYSSTRRDNGISAPFKTIEVGGSGELRGGVVTSIEGQEFYKRQLERRIAQLNRMNALAQGYAVEMGQTYKTDDNMKTGPIDKVQFFVYLQSACAAIAAGDLKRFSFENLKDLIELFLAFVPKMSIEDINDTYHVIDLAVYNIRNGLSEEPEFADIKDEDRAYADILQYYMERIRYVTAQVYKYYGSDPKTIKSLVQSLRRSEFETILIKGKTPMNVLNKLRSTNARINQLVENYDAADSSDGRFDKPAEGREDGEQRGIPRQPYAGRNGDENRAKYGRKTGDFTRGGPQWFGDEPVIQDEYEDLNPQYVAPLGMAGFDPNAERAPRANTQVIREALENVIYAVLEPLGYKRDGDVEEFVARNYPNPNNFVSEVANAMEERNFSKAQIAEGMRLTKYSVFADYIDENAGDIEPAEIKPARQRNPFVDVPAPIFSDQNNNGKADIVAPQDMGAQKERDLLIFPKAQIAKLGLPATREEMYRNYRTEAQYRALGLAIPKEMGGPYRMRSGTTLKNAKAYIIKLYKRYVDPEW